MKKFSFTIIIFLISAGSFCSCSKKGNSEPMEIPFTEYSLVGTLCQWTNFDYADKVIVINGNEDLGKYIECTDGNYPEIDFSKHTLLLTSGHAISGIDRIDVIFYQNAANEYTLEVSIRLGITAIIQKWNIAVITSKISDKTNITLKIEQY